MAHFFMRKCLFIQMKTFCRNVSVFQEPITQWLGHLPGLWEIQIQVPAQNQAEILNKPIQKQFLTILGKAVSRWRTTATVQYRCADVGRDIFGNPPSNTTTYESFSSSSDLGGDKGSKTMSQWWTKGKGGEAFMVELKMTKSVEKAKSAITVVRWGKKPWAAP